MPSDQYVLWDMGIKLCGLNGPNMEDSDHKANLSVSLALDIGREREREEGRGKITPQ